MKYYKISDTIPSVNAEDYQAVYYLSNDKIDFYGGNGSSIAAEGEGYIIIGVYNAFAVFEDEVEIELVSVNGVNGEKTEFVKLTKGLWFSDWEDTRTVSIVLKNTQE